MEMEEKNDYIIIVAGGKGLRMGSDVPKQFLPVGGKPVLMHTLERFHAYGQQLAARGRRLSIILVLPREQQGYWQQLCKEHAFQVPHRIADGGRTRFESSKNGLALVPETDDGVVGIHDGVRPLVSPALVRRMLDRMEEEGCRALLPVVPVVDTLRSTDPATPDPDRSRIVAVQTPQIFRSEDIKAAYTQAYDLSFTDDASVAARKEIPLTLEQGERFNLKITTPEDLLLAEAILTRR